MLQVLFIFKLPPAVKFCSGVKPQLESCITGTGNGSWCMCEYSYMFNWSFNGHYHNHFLLVCQDLTAVHSKVGSHIGQEQWEAAVFARTETVQNYFKWMMRMKGTYAWSIKWKSPHLVVSLKMWLKWVSNYWKKSFNLLDTQHFKNYGGLFFTKCMKENQLLLNSGLAVIKDIF